MAGVALLPHAAVRTAGAVRDLSDSNLIVRLTRGRGWIAVLCALLGGIVALNVISLSLNAGAGQTSQQIEALDRRNSALRAELARKLSASRLEVAAANLGLIVPPPSEIRYLIPKRDDARRLASLLESGSLFTAPVAEYYAPVDSQPAFSEPAPVAEAIEEAATDGSSTVTPPESTPAAPTEAPGAPAEPTTAPSGASGAGTGTSGGVGL